METLGTVFVISAPSGAGKTSLVQGVRRRVAGLGFSVSYTTRRPRPGEVHGEHYYFVDKQTFLELMDRGEFIEHALVFGEYYGTSKSQVQGMLQDGQDVILEIDWQGARQVRKGKPDCVSVFILPPSRVELERRLRGRGSDAPEVIERRLFNSREEIAHAHEFDYIIVNDRFEDALGDLRSIVRAVRQRAPLAARRHESLIEELLAP
jgi:guanylate kinase